MVVESSLDSAEIRQQTVVSDHDTLGSARRSGRVLQIGDRQRIGMVAVIGGVLASFVGGQYRQRIKIGDAVEEPTNSRRFLCRGQGRHGFCFRHQRGQALEVGQAFGWVIRDGDDVGPQTPEECGNEGQPRRMEQQHPISGSNAAAQEAGDGVCFVVQAAVGETCGRGFVCSHESKGFAVPVAPAAFRQDVVHR